MKLSPQWEDDLQIFVLYIKELYILPGMGTFAEPKFEKLLRELKLSPVRCNYTVFCRMSCNHKFGAFGYFAPG